MKDPVELFVKTNETKDILRYINRRLEDAVTTSGKAVTEENLALMGQAHMLLLEIQAYATKLENKLYGKKPPIIL